MKVFHAGMMGVFAGMEELHLRRYRAMKFPEERPHTPYSEIFLK
jgi:hypothetical protein